MEPFETSRCGDANQKWKLNLKKVYLPNEEEAKQDDYCVLYLSLLIGNFFTMIEKQIVSLYVNKCAHHPDPNDTMGPVIYAMIDIDSYLIILPINTFVFL